MAGAVCSRRGTWGWGDGKGGFGPNWWGRVVLGLRGGLSRAWVRDFGDAWDGIWPVDDADGGGQLQSMGLWNDGERVRELVVGKLLVYDDIDDHQESPPQAQDSS